MDDMMYRYNNQNSIYVLNSSINSYGDFGRLNLLACPQLNPAGLTNDDRSANCPESQLTALSSSGSSNNNSHNYNNTSCSSVTRSLQYKLKTLGSLSATEAIGNSAGIASSMSLSSQSSNGVGTTCSPAAAALQKLFNCTSVTGNINGNNTCNSSSCNMGGCSNSSNINIRDCRLSMTEADAMRDSGAMLSNSSNNITCNSSNKGCSSSSNTYSNNTTNNNNNSNSSKKKSTNVKSTLIAKKSKFLKFLEEEKWRANDDSIENLSTTNCERNRGDGNTIYSNSTALRGNSTAFNAISTSSAASTTRGSFQHNNNSNSNSNHYVAATSTSQQQQQPQQHQQYKSNNWSGNHDSNNQKQQQKTSSELYKEAAELLGLSCTLCDNCRCLDCQSGYFDCDDSDSYSELSFMDEYDEEVAATAATTTSVFMMQADYEYDENDTEQLHKIYTQQQQQHELDQQHEYQHQVQQLDGESTGEQQQQDFLACNGIDCNNDNSVENTGNFVDGTTSAAITTSDAGTTITNEDTTSNVGTTTNDSTTIYDSQASDAITIMPDVAINDGLSGVHLTLTDNEMSNVAMDDAGLMPCINNSDSSSIIAQSLSNTAAATSTSTTKTRSQLNELEHCASFNELSLMDARRRDKTHDCVWAAERQQHVACGGSK